MALSGSTAKDYTSKGSFWTWVEWSATQNITNNTSTITAITYGGSNEYGYYSGANKWGYVTIDGTQTSAQYTASWAASTTKKELHRQTKTVTHSADGTKSISISGKWNAGSDPQGSFFSLVSGPTTFTLDTIARASVPTLSASSGNLGAGVVITTNRASTSFTHYIYYAFAGKTGEIGSSVGTSITWSPPAALASDMPNATSGTLTIHVDTWNGPTYIGASSVSYTVLVPNTSTYTPTCAISSVTEGGSNLSTFTVFVQGKSKFVVASTASAKYGASITQYKVTIDGSNYYGSSITSAIISKSGPVVVSLTVTDSRGYTNTVTNTPTVQAYSAPQIIGFSANRSPTDQGTDLSAPVNFSISPVSNQNIKSYKVEYRISGAATWTSAVSSTAYYTRSYTQTNAGILLAANSYEVRLTVSDSFSIVTSTETIMSGFQLQSTNASGRAIAFGKSSEIDGAMEIAMPLYRDGYLQPVTYHREVTFFNSYVYAFSVNTSGSRLASSVRFTIRGTSGSVVLAANVEILTNHFDGALISGTSGDYTPIAVQVKCNNNSSMDVYVKHGGPTSTTALLEIQPTGMCEIEFSSKGYNSYTKELSLTLGGHSTTGASSALSAYPVGAIYMSVVSTSPATLFGGTWSSFGAGRVLVGFDSGQTEFNASEKTGGSKLLQSHTHTASTTSAGAHTHTIGYQRMTASGIATTTSSGGFDLNRPAGLSQYGSSAAAQSNGAHTHPITVDSAGSGTAENLQPYITVYMWKRTA